MQHQRHLCQPPEKPWDLLRNFTGFILGVLIVFYHKSMHICKMFSSDKKMLIKKERKKKKKEFLHNHLTL